MRKTVILCDRCKKEIVGYPILISPVVVDRGTGDILEDYRPEEFNSREYCESCTEKIMAAALGLVEKKEFKELSLEETKENRGIKESKEVTIDEEKAGQPDEEDKQKKEPKQDGAAKKKTGHWKNNGAEKCRLDK